MKDDCCCFAGKNFLETSPDSSFVLFLSLALPLLGSSSSKVIKRMLKGERRRKGRGKGRLLFLVFFCSVCSIFRFVATFFIELIINVFEEAFVDLHHHVAYCIILDDWV